jgi:dipeptidyl aminopeptidase/acylaminoacyl peptidase
MIAAVSLPPDGTSVAVVMIAPDLEADLDRLSLWISPADRAEWEHCGPADALARPQFSPDGTALAGFAPAAGGAGQVLMAGSTAGGTLRQIAPACLADGRPAWDPSGGRIAYTGFPLVPEHTARPVRATSLGFELDGRGWLGENVRQVHIAAADGGPAGAPVTRLTQSPTDCADVAWAPDGESVVYVSARHDTRTRDFGAQAIRLDVAGQAEERKERILTGADLVPCCPAFTTDGTALVLAALTGADGAGRSGALFAVDPRDGDRVRLTDPVDCDIAHPLTAPSYGVSVVAHLAFTLRLADGAVHLIAADIDRPGTWWTVLGGPVQVTSMAATAGGVAVAVYGADGRGQVAVLDAAETARRPEPRSAGGPAAGPGGPAWPARDRRAATGLASPAAGPAQPLPRKFTTRTTDGETISSWLLLPAAAKGPVPLVVWLHGGPMAQAGWLPPPDARALARQGIACVYINPRGSAGRGTGFARAVIGRLGIVDGADVTAVVTEVAALAEIDESRIGVQGGSYGGYLAAMLWSGSALYQAAVVERSITCWRAHRAISDLGVPFMDGYWPGGPPQGERPDPVSVPLRNRSPVLIVAGENDRRCPLAESQLLFARLLADGVEAELAILRGAGHSLAAAAPSVRGYRATLIADWWSRHLVRGEAG